MSPGTESITFTCRRIGHANMAVSAIDRAESFYRDVVGLAFVFRVDRGPQLFFSNGNSHHDIAMTPVDDRSDALVNDGRWRPVRRTPGVNHLGFELSSQVDMALAHENVVRRGVPLLGVMDHSISWGVYVADPEGNQVELYSDSLPNWSEFFSDHMGEGIGKLTQPPTPAKANPSQIHGPYKPAVPDDQAAIRPRRLSAASLKAKDVTLLSEFYRQVVGLDIREDAGGVISLGGSANEVNLSLVPSRSGESRGVFRLTFDLCAGESVTTTLAQLEAHGQKPTEVDVSGGSFVIADPDGLELEFRETSDER